MNKIQQLKELEESLLTNRVCSDLADQAIQLVFGHGSEDAEVVFVGEAPGKREDETGMPFVGASGKFLDTMLESIQLSRDQIYLTNIVKYRPPKNRDPSNQEKQEMMSYLKKQIEIIRPKLIVFLGRHSASVFLPGIKISQDHGKLFEIEAPNGSTWNLLPLYHPAAALYNGRLRQVLLDDFGKIPTILKSIK